MLFDHVIDELFPEVLTSADDDPLKGLVRAARADEWTEIIIQASFLGSLKTDVQRPVRRLQRHVCYWG